MNIQEFLSELNKPRKERKWIEKKKYKRLLLEYRNSPEVLQNIKLNDSIKAKQDKSKRYKRW